MYQSTHRRGFSLVEVILATIVMAVIAVAVMNFSHQPNDRVKKQACDAKIAELQLHVLQYQADYGQLPSANMAELADIRYLGQPLSNCPVDGSRFVLNRSTGLVVTHGH
jgi:prepilin-type N-terminal cleavage/methylation domain-containing protein